MALTPEEQTAVEKDIRHGIRTVIVLLKDIEKSMPLAINSMNGAATSTRKLLAACNKLVEARQEFEAVLNWDIKINPNAK